MKDKNISKLRTHMGWAKFFFYFTRNSPCHTKKYYFQLIALMRNDWQKLDPFFRTQWMAAVDSFDSQIGIVKTLNKMGKECFMVADTPEKEKKSTLDEINGKLDSGITELKNELSEVKTSVNSIERACNYVSDVKKLSDNLKTVQSIVDDLNRKINQ